MWRSFVRAYPATTLTFAVGVPVLIVEKFIDDGPVREFADSAGIVVAVACLLLLGVILYNRPKFLVAPHHRHQQGLLGELGGLKSGPTPPSRGRQLWPSRHDPDEAGPASPR